MIAICPLKSFIREHQKTRFVHMNKEIVQEIEL